MQRISKKASLVTAAVFLFSGFFILSGTASAMTVTPAIGGGAISADTNTTNGVDPTWALLTGPTIAESGNRELTLTANRTIVFSAPAGFEFNTGNLVTATITRTAGAGACFTFVSRNVTPTSSDITYTIASRDTNDGSTICQVSFSNIQVRPSSGTPLASGKITNTGTNTSVPRGAATSYGNLAEIAGAVSASASTITASTPPISTDGGTATITVAAKDLYGNPLAGIASADVVLAVNPTAGTSLIQPFSATNASGETFGMLQSTLAGTKTITARISSILLANSATEIFGPGVPTTGNIVAAPGANVEADLAGTTVTLTVTLTDGHGNLAADNTVVNLQSDLGTIGGSGNTVNGIVTRTLTYNSKGVAHLSFNGGGLTATGDTTITFQDTTLPVISPDPIPDILGTEATSSGGATVNYANPTAFDNIDGVIPVNCVPVSGSTFPLGNNIVTCSATDSALNTKTLTFTIQVVDTTAPVITPSPDILGIEATSFAGAVASYVDPTATDIVDGPVAVSCLPASGSTFPVGNNTVTCSATDSNLNTGISTFTVQVVDTTIPNITAPVDITTPATGVLTPVALGSPVVSDIADPAPVVTNDAPVAGFPVGITTVTWTATDASLNSNTAIQTVTITDSTPPIIAPHGDEVAEATSAAGAVVAYVDPIATDLEDPSITVICLPASGSTFPLGDTTVTCNASDDTGNPAIPTTFTVTVQDTTGPAIDFHADETAEATSPAGAVVNYTNPNANDLVDGPIAVTCLPVSGSPFVLGDTVVNCGAIDSRANASSSSFTVHVVDTTAPVISLLGSSPINVEYNSVYTDDGATALDIIDGDLTASIVTVNPVNTSVLSTYTVTYNVSDSAGNKAVEMTRTVNVIDTVPPVIASITSDAAPAGVIKIGDTITFTLTPVGSEPGATVNGPYNGQTLVWSTADGGVTYTATYTVTGGDPDQSSALQIIGVIITDGGGNPSAPVDGADVQKTIDANLPILSSVSIQSNNINTAWANTGDTVTLTFTSNEDIQTPTVTIEGNPAVAAGGPASWTATYVMTGAEAEGLVVFSIDFADLAGNSGASVVATTDASNVTFDKTAPLAPAVSLTNPVNSTNQINTAITGTGEANTTINYTITDGAAATVVGTGTVAGDGTINITGIDVSSLADGILNLSVVLTDLAGNPGVPGLNTATKGTAIPALTAVLTPNSGYAKTGDTISVVLTSGQNDLTLGGSCTINSKDVSSSFVNNTDNTYSLTYVISEGDSDAASGALPISCTLQDTLGNPAVVSSFDANTLIVDANKPVAPSVALTNPINIINQAITAITGSGDANATINYTITDGAAATIVGTGTVAGDGTINIGPIDASSLADGTLNISVILTDLAGNIGDAGLNTAIKDTTAPSITAPADIDQPANGFLSTVVLGDPVVSDNLDPSPVVINDGPAGYPVGTTVVTWTATDASGNSASVPQNVTIQPGSTASLALLASPNNLAFDQTSLITVTGQDAYGHTATNDNSTAVVLSADGGGSLDNTVLTLSGGVSTANLTKDSAGTVHVTASSDGLAPLAVTVTFTETDISNPFVQSQSPADDTTGVAINIQPYLTFSEPLNSSTVTSSNIQLRKFSDDSAVSAVVSLVEGGRQVNIAPSANLDFNTQYYFAVSGGVTDLAGNGATVLDAGTKNSYEFTTAADSTILKVTGSSAVKTYATADGTFANGWQWVFDITTPMDEVNLQMKFADWVSGANTIPAANNIRFYSSQSGNADSDVNAIVISAANTYSPIMALNGDLDSNTPGRQIQITVEVSVPVGTPGGSYSTSYAIQTNPGAN